MLIEAKKLVNRWQMKWLQTSRLCLPQSSEEWGRSGQDSAYASCFAYFRIQSVVSCWRKFTDEVIEEVTSFPNGDHDDFCDGMTMALMRFRQGGFTDWMAKSLKTTHRHAKKYY